ncbi:MAG: methyltransferase domain-containing protein [Chloroflexi bacterium]|nr:methyltransferase domain-containing protein [Chloroflexota bacterium]
MGSNSTQKIVNQIREKYDIGSNFAVTFLESWFGTKEFTEEQYIKSLQDPASKTWFDFAITTNERGRLLAKSIKPFLHTKASRFLDAGCGYGGFLIGFHELGLDVFGFDLDPKLISLSKANLKDYNLPEDRVQIGDLLDVKLLATLGKFDAIVCNDVLEHVSDVATSMEHLAQLLSPHGVLTIQVPNKDYIGYISHDGHYNLFGIIFLEHNQAKEYYRSFFHDKYDVGEYYELKYYAGKLKSLGYNVTFLPASLQKGRREAMQLAIQTVPDFFNFIMQAGPPWRLKIPVALRYGLYMLSFCVHGFTALLFLSKKTYFKQKYLSGSWVIVAREK